MSSRTAYRYYDVDKILNNAADFFATLIGSILAFFLGYSQITWVHLDDLLGWPAAPTTLTLNIAVVLLTIALTRNLASALLVSLSLSIGLVNSYGSSAIAGFEFFLVSFLLAIVFTGYLVNRFNTVSNWAQLQSILTIVSVLIFLSLGHYARLYSQKYWSNGVNIGVGGDIEIIGQVEFAGYKLPLMDIVLGLVLVVINLTVSLRFRSASVYSSETAKNMKMFGILVILGGLAFSVVSSVLYVARIDEGKLTQFHSQRVIEPLIDLITKEPSATVMVSPFNIFFTIAISITLFNVGSLMYYAGEKKDTLGWIRGGENQLLFAGIWFILVFLGSGILPLQELFYRGGYYLDEMLYPIYLTELWALFSINTAVVWVIFRIGKLLVKNDKQV